jgi:hypothetical protein
LGSIGKVEIKLGETVIKTKFTPPSLIEATPNVIASNHSDVCPTQFSNGVVHAYMDQKVTPLTSS